MQLQKKICLLGMYSVGKTSLIERFVYHRFSDHYLSTLGAKVTKKSLQISASDGQQIEYNLLIWDIAGEETENKIPPSYLLGAAGAILVADLLRPETMEALPSVLERFKEINPGAAVVLAGNKQDLLQDIESDSKEILRLAHQLKLPCHLTSAKTGCQVDSVFSALASSLLSRDEANQVISPPKKKAKTRQAKDQKR